MKNKILKLFKELMPEHFQYHEEEINDFIDYMIKREKDKTYWCIQDYAEDIRMEFCNGLAKNIIHTIVDKKNNNYAGASLQKREPKDEYDKGVLSCLGLIYHIQHCMNPG